MPGRSYNSGEYRYGFNGMEKDDEVKGSGNSYDFGARMYDPRIAIWLKVDPRAADLPGYSPYSYAAGNPVLYIDPNGEFPFTFHMRTFAPFDYFGGGFTGDGADRKFSTTHDAKFKIRSEIDIETETMEVTRAMAYGSTSQGLYGLYNTPSEASGSYGFKNQNLKSHLYGNNDAAPGSSDIDVFSTLQVGVSEGVNGNQLLSITGGVSGDKFPAAEAFISDAKGNSLFLGVTPAGAGPVFGPYLLLPFANERPMMTNININVSVDQDGVFNGVETTDANGNEVTMSPAAWNESFESQSPTGDDE